MRRKTCVALTVSTAMFLSAPLSGSQFIMPIFEPPVSTSTTFTPVNLRFMSATGSDGANGLTPATAWATPNHAMNCGDVIIALAGTYPSTGFPGFGTVSNCPSTTGGIDGRGGIYFAIVLCAGPDLASCDVPYTGRGTGAEYIFDIQASNWAIEGFQVHGNGGGCPTSGQCGAALVVNGQTALLHHHAFINNVVYNAGIGLDALGNGTDHSVPSTNAYDYTAYVGNIAQNSEQNVVCTAQIVMVDPGSIDTNAGTHFLMYGNFAWDVPNNACGSDLENFMFDTWDAHQVTNQSVMLNNVGWSSWRFSFQNFIQDVHDVTGLHVYLLNNTSFNGSLNNASFQGDFNIQMDNSGAPAFSVLRNISQTLQTNPCAINLGGAHGPGSLVNITYGSTGNENVGFGGSGICVFNGGPAGTNFTTNPNFNNTTDLLSNRTGVPNCTGFPTVTACMGWNANTSVLTNPSVIYDLTPTCAQCGGKGYQLPSTTCVSAGDIATLYPAFLKGVVRLQWNASNSTITQMHDLVTTPCGL